MVGVFPPSMTQMGVIIPTLRGGHSVNPHNILAWSDHSIVQCSRQCKPNLRVPVLVRAHRVC